MSRLAMAGICLVIDEFRTDVTKTRKDGSRGKLRIDYGDSHEPEVPVKWLWKFIDGAHTAGELYGRALVVIAAEQYACRLVVPQSQRSPPSSWSSHKGNAAKALEKLAGPHLPGSLRQLETAVKRAHDDCARAERDTDEPEVALSAGKRRLSPPARPPRTWAPRRPTSSAPTRRTRPNPLRPKPRPAADRGWVGVSHLLARMRDRSLPTMAALTGCGGSGIGPASGGGPSHLWRHVMAKRRPVLTEEQREQRRVDQRALVVAAIEQLRSSSGWRAYLDARARFRSYSARNVLMIVQQHPTAERVAGFRAWLALRYCPMKGSRAIRIWAPCPPGKRQLQAWRDAGADPETKPRTAWRLASVFDRLSRVRSGDVADPRGGLSCQPRSRCKRSWLRVSAGAAA